MYHVELLRKELKNRIAKNPKYSLRAFALCLGLHPSALSRVLAGKLLLTFKGAVGLSSRLRLSEREEKLFLKSVASARRQKETLKMKAASGAKSPASKKRYIAPEINEKINSLAASAIMHLTGTVDFVMDPEWVSRRLGLKKSVVEEILQVLIESDVLVFKEGVLRKSEDHTTNLSDKATSDSLRNHQKQILKESIIALENIPVESRAHFGLTMVLSPEKLPEIKKRLVEFMSELAEEADFGNETEVYQMGIHLFPLSVSIE